MTVPESVWFPKLEEANQGQADECLACSMLGGGVDERRGTLECLLTTERGPLLNNHVVESPHETFLDNTDACILGFLREPSVSRPSLGRGCPLRGMAADAACELAFQGWTARRVVADMRRQLAYPLLGKDGKTAQKCGADP